MTLGLKMGTHTPTAPTAPAATTAPTAPIVPNALNAPNGCSEVVRVALPSLHFRSILTSFGLGHDGIGNSFSLFCIRMLSCKVSQI